MSNKKPLTAKEKRQIDKQRKDAAKQAREYHRTQEKTLKKAQVKKNSKSSEKPKVHSSSKIVDAVNSRPKNRRENISREEKFRLESEKKIRNLAPKDYDDGYYIDEYGERRRQERRAKEIHRQESEVIHRRKKPLTAKQIKRRRILICSGIFVLVLAIGIVLSLTVLFKTEKIEIEGDEYYYEDQIIAFSGVELQQNIFIAALGSTPQTIIDNLPYIEDAKINFNIPDTIIIKITNAVPAYVIKNGNSYLLISSNGRILENIDDNKDKLPELTCDELKSTEVGDYVSFSDKNIPDILQDISESLRANSVENITGFDVTNTANITLDYDNRIKINIGLPEDIDYKIRTAMTIINEKLDPNNTGTIAGTLDVSSCNTTKMSHYKPAETAPTIATQPSTAVSAAGGTTYDDSYTWNSDTAADYDSYNTDTYDYGGYDDNSYDNDTYDYGGYDDNSYDNDTYDYGGYDDSYDTYSYDDGYSNDSYNTDTYDNYGYGGDTYTE